MFALCHFKSSPLSSFVLFDSEPFSEILESLNIELEKIIHLKDYPNFPLVELNSLIIHSLNAKIKTNSTILSKENIDTFAQLEKEYIKILQKTSKLSASKRKRVVDYYNEVISILDV